MALRLIIADDHPLLVEGLQRVLEEISGLQVVASVANGKQLLATLRQTKAEIILLDLQMPRLDGIDTLRIVKKEFPQIKVIVFTNYGQPKLIKEIKMLGADGFLLKDSTSVILKEAVNAVAQGNKWFANPASERVTEDPRLVSDFMKKFNLTDREIEIIGKIVEGLTTKEIASQLFLSEFTINSHRRNIGRKLEIYTPLGLLNFAKEHGLI